MNKAAWIVVLVLVLGGGYWWMNKSAAPVSPVTTETPGEAGTAPVSPATPGAPATTQTVTISWKNDAFTPANVEIKAGDSVMFKNDGAKDFFLASNPHPAHTAFPGLNKGTIAAGASATVTFSVAGTYAYHNHLNPTVGGVITVK